MLKLTIHVPLNARFAQMLANATAFDNLDDAQHALDIQAGQSYIIYRGGHHIALHEKAPHSHVCVHYGPRIAMIQDN